jgi:hypothetical protein
MAKEPLREPPQEPPPRDTIIRPPGPNAPGEGEDLTTPTPDQELVYNPGYSDHGRPKNDPNPGAPHAGSVDNPPPKETE